MQTLFVKSLVGEKIEQYAQRLLNTRTNIIEMIYDDQLDVVGRIDDIELYVQSNTTVEIIIEQYEEGKDKINSEKLKMEKSKGSFCNYKKINFEHIQDVLEWIYIIYPYTKKIKYIDSDWISNVCNILSNRYNYNIYLFNDSIKIKHDKKCFGEYIISEFIYNLRSEQNIWTWTIDKITDWITMYGDKSILEKANNEDEE